MSLTFGIPRIDPTAEKSNSTKYSAVANHSLTSSLFEPAIVGTLFTISLLKREALKPASGITTLSDVSSGISS